MTYFLRPKKKLNLEGDATFSSTMNLDKILFRLSKFIVLGDVASLPRLSFFLRREYLHILIYCIFFLDIPRYS